MIMPAAPLTAADGEEPGHIYFSTKAEVGRGKGSQTACAAAADYPKTFLDCDFNVLG
jgi:hypothetical protein